MTKQICFTTNLRALLFTTMCFTPYVIEPYLKYLAQQVGVVGGSLFRNGSLKVFARPPRPFVNTFCFKVLGRWPKVRYVTVGCYFPISNFHARSPRPGSHAVLQARFIHEGSTRELPRHPGCAMGARFGSCRFAHGYGQSL